MKMFWCASLAIEAFLSEKKLYFNMDLVYHSVDNRKKYGWCHWEK